MKSLRVCRALNCRSQTRDDWIMVEAFENLPFFVYGTLLPEQPNYYLWGKSIVSEQTAVLENGRLYDLGSYPILIETEGESVKGMVITVKTGHYADVIKRLDFLEGYDPEDPEAGEYVRVKRLVTLADGTAVATWVYVGRGIYLDSLPIVTNGDWVLHVRDRRQQIDSWWQRINSVSGLHDDLL